MKQNETYFETIRCEDYEVFHLEYHNQRIANTIGMNFNLQEYIYPTDHHLLKCKVVYNNNEILDVSFSPYKKREIKKFKIVYANEISYKYKSTNRENIDRLYLEKENCDEIIIVKDNYITDTTIANIAIELNGKWITPKVPLLFGTTRARLLETEQLKIENITVQDLQKANKFALMNAMIGFDIVEDFEFLL